jgi:hypothetical protein
VLSGLPLRSEQARDGTMGHVCNEAAFRSGGVICRVVLSASLSCAAWQGCKSFRSFSSISCMLHPMPSTQGLSLAFFHAHTHSCLINRCDSHDTIDLCPRTLSESAHVALYPHARINAHPRSRTLSLAPPPLVRTHALVCPRRNRMSLALSFLNLFLLFGAVFAFPAGFLRCPNAAPLIPYGPLFLVPDPTP